MYFALRICRRRRRCRASCFIKPVFRCLGAACFCLQLESCSAAALARVRSGEKQLALPLIRRKQWLSKVVADALMLRGNLEVTEHSLLSLRDLRQIQYVYATAASAMRAVRVDTGVDADSVSAAVGAVEDELASRDEVLSALALPMSGVPSDDDDALLAELDALCGESEATQPSPLAAFVAKPTDEAPAVAATTVQTNSSVGVAATMVPA